jgi:hypothetical protein
MDYKNIERQEGVANNLLQNETCRLCGMNFETK